MLLIVAAGGLGSLGAHLLGVRNRHAGTGCCNGFPRKASMLRPCLSATGCPRGGHYVEIVNIRTVDYPTNGHLELRCVATCEVPSPRPHRRENRKEHVTVQAQIKDHQPRGLAASLTRSSQTTLLKHPELRPIHANPPHRLTNRSHHASHSSRPFHYLPLPPY